jgi:hypothetical protein
MSGALTLIVFVAGTEPDSDVATSLARAAREALGADARIDLRAGSPTDEDAVDEERRGQAAAVVELSFLDPKHRAGRLRVHVAQSGRWLERSIGFAVTDAEAERGRTLGFAAASMLPETGGEGASPNHGAASSPPAPAPGSTAAPTSTSARPEASAAPAPPLQVPPLVTANLPPPEAPPSPSRSTRESPSREPWRPPSFVLDIFGMAYVGAGSSSFTAFGGGVSGQYFVTPLLGLRLGGGVLAGTVPEAEATTLFAVGRAGVSVSPFRAGPGHPVGLGGHVDYACLYESMTHFISATSSSTTNARVQSGVEAMLEVEWLLPSLSLVGGFGGEEVFSPTYVDVRGALVATLPELRFLGEIGVRARF